MGRATTRLDTLLVERGLAPTRNRASALIRAGAVLVDERPVDKPGTRVPADAALRLRGEPLPYVSRGGLKLAAGLDAFGVDPAGRCCADFGASTGGFTDCLLQHGAAKVYAIDVGYGQLAWKLRRDPRVVVMERTNARYLQALPERVGLIVSDLSFISLRLVYATAVGWLASGGQVISLIKPQFEAGRTQVGKGGVVRDARVHRQVLETVAEAMARLGLGLRGLMASPLLGPAGNVEFLGWWQLGAEGAPLAPQIEAAMAEAEALRRRKRR